jgi:hypothetical protein
MKLASNQVALRRETASIVVQWQELSLHVASNVDLITILQLQLGVRGVFII